MTYFSREKHNFETDPEMLIPPPTAFGGKEYFEPTERTSNHNKFSSNYDSFEYEKADSHDCFPKSSNQYDSFTKSHTTERDHAIHEQEGWIKLMESEMKKVELEREKMNARICELERRQQFHLKRERENDNNDHTMQMLNRINEMRGEYINIPTNTARRGSKGENFYRKLRKMPTFSGENLEKMKDFIQSGDLFFGECKNQTESDEFYFQVKYNLRGEAREIFRYTDNDWLEIRHALKKRFAYLMNRDIINSKLENLHQERGESLQKFAKRAQKTLTEKYSVYDEISNKQREDYNSVARRAFINGIKDKKIRERLSTRATHSLENAIASALEMENEAKYEIPESELFCTTCERSGHREQNCKHRKQSGDIAKHFAKALGFSKDQWCYQYGDKINEYGDNEHNNDQNYFSNSEDDTNNFESNNNHYTDDSEN